MGSKKMRARLAGFFAIIILTALLATPASAKLNAVVSIPPQKYFVEKVGGDLVSVTVMVPPGADAHTYEPRPRQMADLAKAKLYFAIGIEFEEAWMEKLQAANTSMLVVHTDEQVTKVAMAEGDHHEHGDKDHAEHDHDKEHKDHDKDHAEHDHDKEHKDHDKEHAKHDHDKEHKDHDKEHAKHDHDKEHKDHDKEHAEHGDKDKHEAEHHDDHHHHDGLDPHIWLDPKLVAIQAKTIRDALVQADPANQTAYDQNLAKFLSEIEQLDKDLAQAFSGIKGKKHLLVYHPAWGYFCRAYGLEQVAIEREGKKPTAKGLAHLIEQAKEEEAKIIFVQPQFSTRSAETVAKAIGGQVIAIDPLAEDWAQNLRRVAQQVKKALY